MRLAVLVFVALIVLPVLAAPVGWRMDGTGLFPQAAMQWKAAPTTVWATELPAWSNASPVLVGDRIFVCAESSTLICMNTDGAILWQRSVKYEDLLTAEQLTALAAEREKMAPLDKQEADLRRQFDAAQREMRNAEKALKDKPDDEALKTTVAQQKAKIDELQPQLAEVRTQKASLPLAEQYRQPPTEGSNGYTSNTPVSDGQRVYVVFGSGVIACFALDGTRQWARLVEKPTHGWGHSCSPLLVGDTLIIQIIDMFALNAQTGEERWRRKLGHNWGTPAPLRIGNLDVVLTDVGELVNVADGKTLGKTGMTLEYGSPLAIGDMAYCASGKAAAAFQFAAQADGTVQVNKLWQTEVANDRYYASPLCYDGVVYIVNQGGAFTALDAKTGEKLYEQNIGVKSTVYSSPVLCGASVLLAGENGNMVVIQAGRTWQELCRPVIEPFRCSPICAGKRVYIRTNQKRGPSKLLCLE